MAAPLSLLLAWIIQKNFSSPGIVKVYDATVAENPLDQRHRLQGALRQQRTDPCQPVGFFSALRRCQSNRSRPGLHSEFSGHLRQPAASQGAAQRAAAERVTI